MGLKETIADIASQERALTFERFDEDVAWALGSQIREWGRSSEWPIVVEVRLFHRQLFFSALPGSTPDNAEWVHRKRNVVERFHRSSYAIGLEMAAKGSTLETRYGLPLNDFAAHGGAFPISITGCGVMGCITVSGLAQRDDHMLVVRALCAVQGKDISLFPLRDVGD
jgi:uncharacterized protein (UPF0303 family)